MQIIEFNETYSESAKDLLVQLQEYIIKIDKFNLNILSKNYREQYFYNTINQLKNNNGKMFLCIDNNKVLGLICGYICPYSSEDYLDYLCPKKGIISELVVSENCQNKGIGHKLIEKMENYFKDCKCEYIQIDVFAYNENAKKFYSKHLYEERLIVLSKKI